MARIAETLDEFVMDTQLAATKIGAMIEELSSVRSAGKAMGLTGMTYAKTLLRWLKPSPGRISRR
ncbi:MAG: hypothetical protein NTX73_03660 [Rhodobacterales bacterium]|nr:hypothetical protein [Rhodobacterales bacterium]